MKRADIYKKSGICNPHQGSRSGWIAFVLSGSKFGRNNIYPVHTYYTRLWVSGRIRFSGFRVMMMVDRIMYASATCATLHQSIVKKQTARGCQVVFPRKGRVRGMPLRNVGMCSLTCIETLNISVLYRSWQKRDKTKLQSVYPNRQLHYL